jgi:hypothetical protein
MNQATRTTYSAMATPPMFREAILQPVALGTKPAKPTATPLTKVGQHQTAIAGMERPSKLETQPSTAVRIAVDILTISHVPTAFAINLTTSQSRPAKCGFGFVLDWLNHLNQLLTHQGNMNFLSEWYDAMPKGQKVFVYLVSTGLILAFGVGLVPLAVLIYLELGVRGRTR